MIDFHCHLDLFPNPHKIVQECNSRNIYILSVTTTPSAWAGTVELAIDSARIRTALGLHPQLAHERKGELPLFDQLLPNTQYVGEVGLDGSPEFKSHWLDQKMVFNRILELCTKTGGKILSIHSRRAATPVLDALEAHPDAGTPILHWFSGNQKEFKRAVEQKCWFSVSPTMLAGKKGRLIVEKMPRDKVLTESDGPFAQFEGRPALPWDTYHTISTLAEIWGMPSDEVSNQLLQNLSKINPNTEL